MPDLMTTHARLILSFAAAASAAGCNGYAGPRSLVNDDPAVKIPQIKSAAAKNDRSAIPQLVKDLDSDDAAVRFYSIQGLRRITGKSFEYEWTQEDRHARQPAVERWRQYAEANP